MKVKIKQEFRDKYTNVLYRKDEVVDFPQERIEEIQKTGSYIEEIKTIRKKTAKGE